MKVYLTLFRFESVSSKWWAFTMMQFAHQHLAKIQGLSFYKLMGSGRSHGFNPLPDFSTYALLTVWDSDEAAAAFFDSSEIYARYKKKSIEQWTVQLEPIKAKGTWDGQSPFKDVFELNPILPVMVLTRATIRLSKSIGFWKYVPTSQKPLERASGLRYTKGVGEWPFVQMATISLWDDQESIRKFAYESEEHKKAIKLTKELNWYKEEMFARFQVVKSSGFWEGDNPLPDLAP